ncbi:MAG: hypothetical protein GY835_08515 [bacterium]|nr:hypothetical protein [bacterium]
MDFTNEEFVVYPRYGVGRVLGVSNKKFAGTNEKCLGIKFEHQNLSLFIPVHRLEKVKLRKLMSKPAIKKVLETMKSRARFNPKETHKERLAGCQEKFNTGIANDLAEVARDLARLSKKQDLNMEEETICRDCINLLAREIAICRGTDIKSTRLELEKVLYR